MTAHPELCTDPPILLLSDLHSDCLAVPVAAEPKLSGQRVAIGVLGGVLASTCEQCAECWGQSSSPALSLVSPLMNPLTVSLRFARWLAFPSPPVGWPARDDTSRYSIVVKALVSSQ